MSWSKLGVSWSEGSELEQAGVSWSELEQGERAGVSWSNGSELE